MFNKKTKKIVSSVIAVLLVAAMVLSAAISIFL